MGVPSLLDRGTISASSHAHTAIAEAVLAGNEGLARHRMRKHLVAEADYLQVRAHTRIGLPRTTSDEKRGQRVATAVLRDIADEGWPVAKLHGTERALVTRYGGRRAGRKGNRMESRQ